MTKHPSRYSVLLGDIINNYGATYFQELQFIRLIPPLNSKGSRIDLAL
jgi:hypothetical protein